LLLPCPILRRRSSHRNTTCLHLSTTTDLISAFKFFSFVCPGFPSLTTVLRHHCQHCSRPGATGHGPSPTPSILPVGLIKDPWSRRRSSVPVRRLRSQEPRQSWARRAVRPVNTARTVIAQEKLSYVVLFSKDQSTMLSQMVVCAVKLYVHAPGHFIYQFPITGQSSFRQG